MKRLFLLLAVLSGLAVGKPVRRGLASTPPEDLCVDFRERVTAPLHAPPPFTAGKVVEISGVRPASERNRTVHWQGARGWIPLSVKDAFDWILDHTRWKEMDKTKLDVKSVPRPGYEAFHVVSQDTKVFAFVRIQWIEEWAYAVLGGTAAAPDHVLTTYQKVAGTGHIRRLCGSVEFRSRASGTDAYFYQEADADHYEVEHIQALHRRFFATLGGGRAVPDGPGASR